jgi:membrane protease YdiL (CAAX protease family)
VTERFATWRLVAWATVIGILAALGYIGRFAGGKLPKDPLYRWDEFVGGLVQFVILLGLILLFARGLSKREAFALRRPSSWRRAVGIMLGIAVIVVVASAALEPVLHPDKEQGLAPTRWEPAHAAAFAANFVVVALLAPVVEELTFRGLGFTLLERFGRWAAILLVGIAFGLAHGLVEALPLLVLFGAGLAYLRSRTGSVYPGIVVHVLYNGLVLLFAVKFFQTGALRILS